MKLKNKSFTCKEKVACPHLSHLSQNIIIPATWFEPGHGTENYGAAKEKSSSKKE